MLHPSYSSETLQHTHAHTDSPLPLPVLFVDAYFLSLFFYFCLSCFQASNMVSGLYKNVVQPVLIVPITVLQLNKINLLVPQVTNLQCFASCSQY